MREVFDALNLTPNFQVAQGDSYNACFDVSQLATSTIGAVGQALSRLTKAIGLSADAPPVTVNHRLASLWFDISLKPMQWTLPPT